MIPLFTRRPTVALIAQRLVALSGAAGYLNSSSMLRYGQMHKAIWFYLDAARRSDTAQAISEQQRLAGIEAATRNVMTECMRYYPTATGTRELTLTQDASAAIDQILAYDPTTTATFDLESTVVRVLRGARIR